MGTKSFEGNETVNVFNGEVRQVAPARVMAELGVTHNLGDYNSVKIVFLFEDNVPEGTTLEDYASELYGRVEALVEEKLGEYEND